MDVPDFSGRGLTHLLVIVALGCCCCSSVVPRISSPAGSTMLRDAQPPGDSNLIAGSKQLPCPHGEWHGIHALSGKPGHQLPSRVRFFDAAALLPGDEDRILVNRLCDVPHNDHEQSPPLRRVKNVDSRPRLCGASQSRNVSIDPLIDSRITSAARFNCLRQPTRG